MLTMQQIAAIIATLRAALSVLVRCPGVANVLHDGTSPPERNEAFHVLEWFLSANDARPGTRPRSVRIHVWSDYSETEWGWDHTLYVTRREYYDGHSTIWECSHRWVSPGGCKNLVALDGDLKAYREKYCQPQPQPQP